VQQIGTPTELYRRPANRFVAGFFGQSNLLEAQVLDAQHVRVLGRIVRVAALPIGLQSGDRVTLSLRPEDIRVLPVDSLAVNTLPGRIRFVRSVGERVELRIVCEGHEIVGVAPMSDWPTTDGGDVAVELVSGAGTVLTA
jgi:ABC-type Fe3+/spermidine/putrescine transport system ATPase subunit